MVLKSLRGRLQAWYAGVLLVVVAGFAGLLYDRTRAARLGEVEGQIESALNLFQVALRSLPPGEIVPPRDRPGGPPPGGPDWTPGFDPPPGKARDKGRDRDKARDKDDRPPEWRGPDAPRFPPGPGNPPRPRPRLLADIELPPNLRFPPSGEEADRGYFAIWRPDGSLLKASPPAREPEWPDFSPETLAADARPRWRPRGAHWEVVQRGPRDLIVLVGRPIQRELNELRQFAWTLALGGAAVLLLGLSGGWLIASRAVRPLESIARTAQTLSARNLGERIPTESLDRELADLALVLNDTFARLDAEFHRQTRFTADASHELRTPLAILQTATELALARPRDPADYQDTLRTSLLSIRRMRDLVDGLLTLARADAGRLERRNQTLDLAELLREAADAHAPAAEQAGVALTLDLPPDPVPIRGDATLLLRVLANLLGNALRHTPPQGRITLALRSDADQARVDVRDTGCGIPEADLPRVFERFFRVEESRARSQGGCGLGLAICRGLVEAHQGRIECQSRPGQGTVFTLHLPRLRPARVPS